MKPALFRDILFWSWVALMAQTAGVCNAEYRAFNPPGSVDGRGILEEVLSRSGKPDYFRQKYSSDLATMCHEATHILNGRASMERGAGCEALYIGDGVVAVFHEPRIRITDVAARIPAQYRDACYYRLYCVTQPSSQPILNAMPLYLMDEWSAAINGAQCARELGVGDTGDLAMSNRFCYFADALLATISQLDPTYREMADLQDFVQFQKKRVAWLNSEQQQRPLARQQTETIATINGQRLRGAEPNTWRKEMHARDQVVQAKPMQCDDPYGSCYGGGWQPATRPQRVVITPTQPQQPKPASYTDPQWVEWRKQIEASVAAIKPCQCDHSGQVTIEQVNQAIALAIANQPKPAAYQPPSPQDQAKAILPYLPPVVVSLEQLDGSKDTQSKPLGQSIDMKLVKRSVEISQ